MNKENGFVGRLVLPDRVCVDRLESGHLVFWCDRTMCSILERMEE